MELTPIPMMKNQTALYCACR